MDNKEEVKQAPRVVLIPQKQGLQGVSPDYKYLIAYIFINGSDVQMGNLELTRDKPIDSFIIIREIKTEIAKQLKKNRKSHVDSQSITILNIIKVGYG